MKHKTSVTIQFIVEDEIFIGSNALNEFDDILLRPLKEGGFKVNKILNADNNECIYEIGLGEQPEKVTPVSPLYAPEGSLSKIPHRPEKEECCPHGAREYECPVVNCTNASLKPSEHLKALISASKLSPGEWGEAVSLLVETTLGEQPEKEGKCCGKCWLNYTQNAGHSCNNSECECHKFISKQKVLQVIEEMGDMLGTDAYEHLAAKIKEL